MRIRRKTWARPELAACPYYIPQPEAQKGRWQEAVSYTHLTFVAGLVAPASVSLVGFLMFGNLIRECGVLNRLSETAQNDLANLITLLLGITIAFSMRADQFVTVQTIMIMALGLVAFIFDTIAGVVFAKILNIFSRTKINPMVGAAGISAFPMSARIVEKMGIAENRSLIHI